MSEGVTAVAYIGARVLFILSLGGLSNQETARRGNLYGIVGMVIAVLATILASQINDYKILIFAVVIGAVIGIFVASRVEMAQMPELVAILHGPELCLFLPRLTLSTSLHHHFIFVRGGAFACSHHGTEEVRSPAGILCENVGGVHGSWDPSRDVSCATLNLFEHDQIEGCFPVGDVGRCCAPQTVVQTFGTQRHR